MIDTRKKIQEQKEIIRKAQDEIDKVCSLHAEQVYKQVSQDLQDFSRFMSAEQVDDMIRILTGVQRLKISCRNQIKYELPCGDTWKGSGKMKTSFRLWGESDEGKKWRNENPGKLFPLYRGGAA